MPRSRRRVAALAAHIRAEPRALPPTSLFSTRGAPHPAAAAASTQQRGTGGPLAGVRVVEMCQMISGPLAAQILADQGADVVKIENANGVGDRFRGGATTPSPAFAFANRGKRSVTLDTKHPDGAGALRKLAAGADVFLQNFRPGVAARMGVGYDDLRALNPGIVYVSVSGFGSDGPYADQMVYDFVIQALCGIADFQQGADGQPELVKNM